MIHEFEFYLAAPALTMLGAAVHIWTGHPLAVAAAGGAVAGLRISIAAEQRRHRARKQSAPQERGHSHNS